MVNDWTCLWLFVYQLIDHKLTSVPTVERNVYLVGITIFLLYFIQWSGCAVAQLVKVLHYKQEGCWLCSGTVGWGAALQAGGLWVMQWHSCSRCCTTSSKAVGSIFDGATWIFYGLNPSGCTVALGSTQPVAELRIRLISWGLKAASAYNWRPYHFCMLVV